MNQIFFLRFIKSEKSVWQGVSALVFVAFLPVTATYSQNSFQSQPAVNSQASWQTPAINSADHIPARFSNQGNAVQQPSLPAPTAISWPEQPVSFESHVKQSSSSAIAPNGLQNGALESSLGSASLAVAGWKEKATGLLGSLSGQTNQLNIPKMLSSLAIVLGAYFGFVWLMRMFNPAGNAQLPAEVVQVLGRTPFGPKQNLQLVRLGHKLVLLINGPEGSHPIGEITEAEEVDYLASLCNQKTNHRTPPPRTVRRIRTPSSTAQPDRPRQPEFAIQSNPADGAASSSANKGLADILRSLEKVVKHSGGNVFEA